MDFESRWIVTAPVSIAGEYEAQPAAFGPPVPAGGISASVVLAEDGTGPDVNDACEALTNGPALNGNIALIHRGTCTFVSKVLLAQAAGAVAVLISNNQPTGLPPMGGDDPTVTIPSYGITQAAGTAIEGELPGVTGTLGFDDVERAGVREGFLRLHAPNPVQQGSSISHWTTAATPSLLMEPSITSQLTDDVDLTLEQFRDIGWNLVEVFTDGFESGNCLGWETETPACVLP
ncbi:MAG: hypothetical protein MI919_24765 [Holophagales bacterium]|nr:hypothetical protein [Holophagales bacterium]